VFSFGTFLRLFSKECSRHCWFGEVVFPWWCGGGWHGGCVVGEMREREMKKRVWMWWWKWMEEGFDFNLKRKGWKNLTVVFGVWNLNEGLEREIEILMRFVWIWYLDTGLGDSFEWWREGRSFCVNLEGSKFAVLGRVM
jgi:hypothetical protein